MKQPPAEPHEIALTSAVRRFAFRMAGRIVDGLDKVASFLDRRAVWCVGAFSLLYFVSALNVIRYAPLWLDEIGGYYVARLPVPAMLRALRLGADNQPPLFFLLMHPLAIIGNPLLLRIPAMIAVWCMSICLCAFVWRKWSRLHGLIALLFPFITLADTYAHEGRPYAIVLGGSAAALLCWQSLDSERWRYGKLTALWLCCSLVVGIHYFGFLILLPLCAGQAVRWLNGKHDFRVAVALVASMWPLIVAAPIVKSLRAIGMTHWGRVGHDSLRETYAKFLDSSLLPACVILIAVLLVSALRRPDPEERSEPASRSSLDPDLVAVAAFAALPIAGVAIGLVAGAMTPRYVIACLTGISAGFASGIARSRQTATVVLLVLGLEVTATFGLRAARRQLMPPTQVPAAAATLDGRPIVYEGPVQYFESHFYAPSATADRMSYLTSPPIALMRTGQNGLEYVIQALGRISDCHVEEYSAFLRQHSQFILVTNKMDAFPWVLAELIGDGAQIRVLSVSGEDTIYQVSD